MDLSGIKDLFIYNNLKTGILYIDIILITCWFMMHYSYEIKNYFKKSCEICTSINNKTVRQWIRSCKKNRMSQILFQGMQYHSGYSNLILNINYPDPIKYILDRYTSEGYNKDKNIRFIESKDNNREYNKFYMPRTNLPIQLDDDIYMQIEKIHITNRDDKGNTCIRDVKKINFTILSERHDVNYIHNYINKCKKIYEKKIDDSLMNIKYIFEYVDTKSIINDDDDDDDDRRGTKSKLVNIICNEYQLNSTKNLRENCFFNDVDKIIKRIDFFINNEEWYKERGIPYQLGFLFYGPPGCGKTSTIKAIAKYMNRHIVNINDLDKIKKISDVKSIFYGNYINGKTIHTDKRILVIDEFDKILDNLQKINNPPLPTVSLGGDMVLLETVDTSSQSSQSSKSSRRSSSGSGVASKTVVNEGELLSILDGLIETRGRVIICTANDTSKISDAFKRPGRLDEHIEFTKCSKRMIKQMLELFYKREIEEEMLERFEKIEYKYSPAELNNICFNNIDNMEGVIKEIMEN